MSNLLKIGIAVLFLTIVIAAQDKRPKVAVITFTNPPNAGNSSIGDGLTSILTSELSQTGKFSLLEREHVEEIKKEIDFGGSEYAKNSTFAKKGQMLGAQYVLTGQVTHFSYSEKGEQKRQINLLGPDNYYVEYQQVADVRVDFRLVDVASGATVLSEAGIARETNKSRVSEEGIFQRILRAQFTLEPTSSLIGKATVGAVKDVVRKLNSLSSTVREASQQASLNAGMERLASAQGEVIGEEGGGLWIVALGNAQGIQKGDHLTVTHDNVVKDKTGRILYKKPAEIGTMEVTDVSMADRAEARFVSGPSSGTAIPQVNDTVRVDLEYARTLRGAAAAPSSTGAILTPVSATTSANEPDRILQRADDYLKDNFATQALDQYAKVLAQNPKNSRALQGQALARYLLGDFPEGDQGAQEAIDAGAGFRVPIAHYHGQGLCLGELIVQKGKVIFKSDKNSDDFDIAPTDLIRTSVHRLQPGFIVNEPPRPWQIVEIVWRSSGHEKKYQMLPYMYSKQPILTGKNISSAFPMDDSDTREMQKFEDSLINLIQKNVK